MSCYCDLDFSKQPCHVAAGRCPPGGDPRLLAPGFLGSFSPELLLDKDKDIVDARWPPW